ncbi:TSPAN7 [Branchiostoma lanceolatum]|uniref:Tetraspanin n=1 Tax=Branchiostoma lanceolatum TaxID=7740 RepID=A0A8K0E951_BRALA|nr:TSPAN7 [Branchiostoma lanceolatum]
MPETGDDGKMSKRMQTKPMVACLKTILMIFNFIFWATGILMLVVGIWGKLGMEKYLQLSTTNFTMAPYVLMGVGGFIVLLGFLGCYATAKGNTALLYIYSFFLFIIFVAELAAGISGFIFRGKLQAGFGDGLDKALEAYNPAQDKDQAKLVDDLQSQLKCCGKERYSDWYKQPWAAGKNNVPLSCCKDQNKCVHEGLTNSTATDIYTVGCYKLVVSAIDSNLGIIGGSAVGIAFFQVIGMLFACCLARNINQHKYEMV